MVVGGSCTRILAQALRGADAQAFMRDVEILGPQANNAWVTGGHLNPGSPSYYSELICQMSGKMGYYTNASRMTWTSSSTTWPSPPRCRPGSTAFAAIR